MLQQFFTDTAINKFIKNLIKNTPLPLVPTVRSGDKIIKGCYYIYRTNLIKCTKTGYLWDEQEHVIIADEDIFVSNTLLVGSGTAIAEYDVKEMFLFGNDYPQLTEKFISKYGYYDSDTHAQLGKYLRCLRDLQGIDLMPFYNCFNYTIISDCYLVKGGKGYLIPSDDAYNSNASDNYKVIAVPIKFNKTYTIALECSEPLLMKSCFYGKLGMLKAKTPTGFDGYLSETLIEANGEKIISKTNTQFQHPFTYFISSDSYDGNMNEKDIADYEKYLYLFIQLPASNKSSIVVLEGDYTHLESKRIFNAEYIDNISQRKQDALMLSPLSLLQMNDGVSYAFSNRLIEYLLDNVITPVDEIFQNISRVQTYVSELSKYLGDNAFCCNYIPMLKGEWDDLLRVCTYNDYINSRERSLDINGYVDKSIEKYITKGRVV